MEFDTAGHEGYLALSAADAAKKQLLIAFLTENTAPLLGTLRSYVQRMGLARGEEVSAVALEILQEAVVEALNHADRFNPAGQPMAWLLGIAVNVIKRKKAELAKRARRETSITDLSVRQEEPLSEGELFDQVASCTLAGPEQDIEANEQASSLLSLVSSEDQRILRLAFLYDCEREALAEQLGISPVAARVRLHRALSRLRGALRRQQVDRQEGESK
ncbi:MAG: sigma-70 family RNA polymerase sigma factor [Ktedonobacteraceae bacterium]|nr:sigma-70 family RNA polymerase sigma factor [Ktedonobacteraceae bacterium]